MAPLEQAPDRAAALETAALAQRARRTLSIVIPALNEEEAIGGTIERCLAAIDPIKREAGLEAVQIVVVSDGSTDRTAQIARSFSEVSLIEFKRNRGYGAAIKEGFRQGTGTLVGFLDADGTCDPRYFGPMCRTVLEENADMVLGSRLGADSRMPAVRRLGNHAFAVLLGFLCGRSVTDTASGMRVVRREALGDLYPLPDGLHFTPSMSARALLGGLRVVEIPISYHERIGHSKLNVLADGWRFLAVIVKDVLCYRPERIFLATFVVCLLFGILLAAYPVEFYALNRRVEEWMIYRFLVCGLVGTTGFQLLFGAAFAWRMSTFGPRRQDQHAFWPVLGARFLEGWGVVLFVAAMVLVATRLLWPGVVEYVTTLHLNMHWSRFVTAIFGLMVAAQAAVSAVVMRILKAWKAQLDCRLAERP